MEAKARQWTIGFDLWVTNASTMSRSLSGSVVKKLGWVLIMAFCTASSAQLYRFELGARHICHLGEDITVNLEFSKLLWDHLNIEIGGLGCQCLDVS